MRLVGDPENKFAVLAHKIELENTAGYLKWQLEPSPPGDDTPSSFDLLLQRNFSQESDVLPSDYVQLRMASLPIDESQDYEDHIFELETIQFEGGNSPVIMTNLTLSKDESDRYLNLNVANLLDNSATNIYINKGYNVVLEATDGTRKVSSNLLNDSNLLNIDLDANYRLTVDNEFNENFYMKGTQTVQIDGDVDQTVSGHFYLTNSDIKLGSSSSSEPLVLGNVMKTLLEEFAEIIKASKHLHPQGPTTGLFPADITKIDNWKAKLPNALSDIATTQKS
jgi:hypothetical protein